MSFRSVFTIIVVILILAVGAGGGAYLYLQKQQENQTIELDKASQMMAKGDHEKALAALETLAQTAHGATAETIAAARIAALAKLGRDKEAGELSDAFLKKYPKSDLRFKAYAVLGRLALDAGDIEKARAWYDEAAKGVASPAARAEAMLGQAKIMAYENDLKGAKAQLEKLLEQKAPPEVTDDIEKELGDLNIQILRSRAPMDEDTVYQMQTGDSIATLAKKYNLTMEVLLRKNGVNDPKRMTTSRRLIIPKCEFSVQVDRNTNTLKLLNGGKFFKKYPCRTGKEDYRTPVGEFTIFDKKKDPQWVDPQTNHFYPGGDPKNELGTRWLAFQGAMLGIHGTIHPDSIGLYTSNGCIGMRMEDVEELYDLIPLKTPLKIVGKQNKEIVARTTAYLKKQAEEAAAEAAKEAAAQAEATSGTIAVDAATPVKGPKSSRSGTKSSKAPGASGKKR